MHWPLHFREHASALYSTDTPLALSHIFYTLSFVFLWHLCTVVSCIHVSLVAALGSLTCSLLLPSLLHLLNTPSWVILFVLLIIHLDGSGWFVLLGPALALFYTCMGAGTFLVVLYSACMPLDLPSWANRLHHLNWPCQFCPKDLICTLVPLGVLILPGSYFFYICWVCCVCFVYLPGPPALAALGLYWYSLTKLICTPACSLCVPRLFPLLPVLVLKLVLLRLLLAPVYEPGYFCDPAGSCP